MATFKRFEDIQAWQKARQATKLVYQITARGDFSKDFGLRDQIRRSSFLNIAHGSIAETQSHLYVALDLDYINQADFKKIYDLLDEISKMVMNLNLHLRKSL